MGENDSLVNDKTIIVPPDIQKRLETAPQPIKNLSGLRRPQKKVSSKESPKIMPKNLKVAIPNPQNFNIRTRLVNR